MINRWYLQLLILSGFLLAGCGQANAALTSAEYGQSTETAIAQNLSTEWQAKDEACKRIAFVIAEGEMSDLYAVCPNGSNLTRLTETAALEGAPAWSPNGKRIAFFSTRTGSGQIYVMDADGSDPKQLTRDLQNDMPVWLPEGREIAFRTTDGQGLWWWRTVDLETGEVVQLTEPSYDFFYQTPAWSRDGQQMATMSLAEQSKRNDGASQIHVMNRDGSGEQALTHDTWANISPAWSPDGEWIAFLSERDGKYNQFALYVMRADGKEVRRLTAPVFGETCRVSWGADGGQIAIDRDLFDGSGGIDIVDVETGDQRKLMVPVDGKRAFSPAWEP